MCIVNVYINFFRHVWVASQLQDRIATCITLTLTLTVKLTRTLNLTLQLTLTLTHLNPNYSLTVHKSNHKNFRGRLSDRRKTHLTPLNTCKASRELGRNFRRTVRYHIHFEKRHRDKSKSIRKRIRTTSVCLFYQRHAKCSRISSAQVVQARHYLRRPQSTAGWSNQPWRLVNQMESVF